MNPTATKTQQASRELARLCDDYFTLAHTLDPFTATQLGVTGFDALVPDPSRDGADSGARRIAALEQRLRAVDRAGLDEAGQITEAVLGHLARTTRAGLEKGLWEANASADGYVAPAAMMLRSVPAVLLRDATDVASYRHRLCSLPGFLDAVTDRYGQAVAEGRDPTRIGLTRAIAQLARYLSLDAGADPLVTVALPDDVDAAAVRAEIARIVTGQVRPAVRRLLDCLRRDLLPLSRPDDQVGIRFVPGGDEAYLDGVARYTTTRLSPEQIHQIGCDRLAEIHAEWADLGGRALGTASLAGLLARLRDDPALRCRDARQIVRTVSDAVARADAVRDRWFPRYDIPDCVTEEIDSLEAGAPTRAYYRPPAAGGLRPAANRVMTGCPAGQAAYAYEALSFHLALPGHHLQIAAAQSQPLPAFRRFGGGEPCGYVEGWGAYGVRLADEMGLYSSDLQRLGMLAAGALDAGRLIVDTGMHYYGWSRARAADFLERNTAATRAAAAGEVDRCIGWPAQALAHLTGSREILRLRSRAERALGPAFDIRAFHGIVLGNGAVPLGVLDRLVTRWTDGNQK